MASSAFDFRITAEKARVELQRMDHDTDRATMWALRAVGRKVKQEARKRAPVYGGTTKSMSINARRSVSVGSGKRIAIVPGLLKNSISSSRQLKRHGKGSYGLTVGPRGGHVHLYAAKQEKNKAYMAPAHDIAAGQLPELAAKAWERAMHKAGRL